MSFKASSIFVYETLDPKCKIFNFVFFKWKPCFRLAKKSLSDHLQTAQKAVLRYEVYHIFINLFIYLCSYSLMNTYQKEELLHTKYCLHERKSTLTNRQMRIDFSFEWAPLLNDLTPSLTPSSFCSWVT